ncbi:hypothetical protein Hanom_Chr12g01169901 [Helianthus anomalus]
MISLIMTWIFIFYFKLLLLIKVCKTIVCWFFMVLTLLIICVSRRWIISFFFLVLNRYASIRAIETKSPVDDQQWLTYWVLYSMITLFELTFAKLIEWIPFWSYAKLIVTCWLVLPYFNGAAYVYEHYVRPFYTGKQTINIWYVPRKKDVFSKPDDILAAAEKYIQEHGPDAFQEIIHRSDRDVRYGGGSVFSEHEHVY